MRWISPMDAKGRKKAALRLAARHKRLPRGDGKSVSFHPMTNRNFLLYVLPAFIWAGCGKSAETIQPVRQDIVESVYASGKVLARDQYQVFPTVSGLIRDIFVHEGDTVRSGDP